MEPEANEIRIRVRLNGEKIPEMITWSAGGENNTPSKCKAFMLALWDEEKSETLRIDLWTDAMQQHEMDTFFFQTLMTMSDTYLRANRNEEAARMIRDFAFRFGEKTELIQKK